MDAVIDQAQREHIELQRNVASLVSDGYRVQTETQTSAQLLKPKKFSLVLFVIGLLLLGVPGLLYLAWYVAKQDKLAYLWIEDGQVRRE